ncbi:MAG: CDP-alcohol phosphatidyltransferase family protein [Thermodesulfobacteriota bacterium]
MAVQVKERYYRAVAPVGDLLARMGIHPHVLTGAGFVLSLLAGLILCDGTFFGGAFILAIAGVCDTLDGIVARKTNKQSPFGAFFDSTLDRYSDFFPLAGMAYHFAGGVPFFGGKGAGEASPWTVLLVFLTISGCFMVSYTRARAEGLGVECREGIMQRAQRMSLLIAGVLLAEIPVVGVFLLRCALVLLAVTSHATAVSRMVHTRRQLRRGRSA